MKNIPLGRVAGAAAIIKDKKILLTKRTPNLPTFPNFWTFPAGGIDDTDLSIRDCVIREVKEETNLDFEPTSKLNFYESLANGKRIISLVYLGNWKGEIKPQENEVSEIKFFSYQETQDLDIAFAYKEVIEDLKKLDLI